MARRDGLETRQKLLDSACRLFAEKGFHHTSVPEICQDAGANCASVSYHFGGKENLYVEVWRHALELANTLYPVDDPRNASRNAPRNDPRNLPRNPQKALHAVLGALIRRMTDNGRLGTMHRLQMHEMAGPTGLIDEVIREARTPIRQRLEAVIREVLGPDASDEDVRLAEMSIIGQCRAAKFAFTRWGMFCKDTEPISEQRIEQLTRHITRFSLAGLRKMRQQAQQPRKELVP